MAYKINLNARVVLIWVLDPMVATVQGFMVDSQTWFDMEFSQIMSWLEDENAGMTFRAIGTDGNVIGTVGINHEKPLRG